MTWAVGPSALPTECGNIVSDVPVRVRYVIDGDTLVLDGGQHIRLIGINSPELHARGKRPEPLATEARNALSALVLSRPAILAFDEQTYDRYHRQLAHAFLPDGTSVEVSLLRLGFATTMVIAPNLKFQDCYAEAQRAARRRKAGLWSTDSFRTLEAKNASVGERVVRGHVARLRSTAKSVFLDLTDTPFSFSVSKADLRNFQALPIQDLVGADVVVRDRVYKRHGRGYMRLRHPSNILSLERN